MIGVTLRCLQWLLCLRCSVIWFGCLVVWVDLYLFVSVRCL